MGKVLTGAIAILLLLLAAALATPCYAATHHYTHHPAPAPAPVVAPVDPNIATIAAAHKLVSARLRDPTSGIFTQDTVRPNDIVCGSVRGKNAYGGYSSTVIHYIVDLKTQGVTMQPNTGDDDKDEPTSGTDVLDMMKALADGLSPAQASIRILTAYLAHWAAICEPKAAPAPAPAPVTPPPAPAPVAVSSVDLGSAAGPDQKVTAAATTFAPKDTIYAAVSTTGMAPSAVLNAQGQCYEIRSIGVKERLRFS
jgi:hypothetical protein